jgi:mono/diheme cytochrome c family protein
MIAKTIVLALLAFVALPAAAFAQVPSGHGKALFMLNNCYLCHGTAGQGGDGPGIAPPKLMSPYERFAAWVRKPGPGLMPPYTAKVLSDADLAAIYGYLQSIHLPAATLPALLTRKLGPK